MWQIWLIIVIILLITIYRYPGPLIFSAFITSSFLFFTSFFTNNLLLELLIGLGLFTLSYLFINHFVSSLPSHSHLSNSDDLINSTGIVTQDIPGTPIKSGLVLIHNENWLAISSIPIPKNSLIKVTEVHGLRITVTPYLPKN